MAKRISERDFNNYWKTLPGTEFLEPEEEFEGKKKLAAFLSAGPGRKMTKQGKPRVHPYTKEFRAFLDYFGYTEHEFNWEDWRDLLGYGD